jgi:dipeptidyl aminopeptidase/acylaminoacyl peptidase
VTWSPDGRWLAYATGRLDQRASTISLADSRDLAGAPLVAYRDSTGALHNLRWSSDGSALLAQDRSWRTILLDVDSAGRATALSHNLPRRRFTGWIPGGEAFLTSVGSGMSRRLAIVRRNGAVSILTGPDTTAAPVGVAAGPSGSRLAYTVTAGSTPLDVWIGEVDSSLRFSGGRRITTSAERVPGPLPQSRIYRWTSGEGDSLQALLLLPAAARAPYPLIIAPYGGYANQFPKLDYFFEAGFLQLLGMGYAIALPNTRGAATDERDRGRYGEVQLEDTKRLVEALASDRLIQPQSVAVMGHSHGGAMAYYYLTHADLWCGVIAVNGRADWMLQARHPGDSYLAELLGGTPDSLPERYAALSPSTNASRASAPVLAVAGMRDTQILPQNVTILRDSMLAYGRQIDTLTFADEGHLILSEVNQAELWRRVTAFLRQHCSR